MSGHISSEQHKEEAVFELSSNSSFLFPFSYMFMLHFMLICGFRGAATEGWW